MNKKGFSLIELLTVIIIIGIIGTIGIVAVSGYIQDSRKSTFADLAMMYLQKASEDRAKDRLPHDIKSGEAILFPLEKYKIDKNEDYSTPYGDMDLDYCYAVITNRNNNYNYYIFMLDDTKHAIVGKEYGEIDSDDVTIEPSEIAKILNYRTMNSSSRLMIGETPYKISANRGTYVLLSVG